MIISFGDEQFAESVVSSKDDTAILSKIEIAIEKQIQKLRTLADLRPLGGLLSLPDELLTRVRNPWLALFQLANHMSKFYYRSQYPRTVIGQFKLKFA